MEEKKRSPPPHWSHTGAHRTLQLLPLILSIRDSYLFRACELFRVPCEGEMAPTKRTWEEANAGPELDAASSLQGSNGGTAGRHGPQQSRPLQNQGAARDAPSTSPTAATSASTSQHIPMISRKIRACASCRKHKVIVWPRSFPVSDWTSLLSILLRRSSALWTRILGHPAKDVPRKTL